jgi:hypothetical protein
MQKLTCAIVAAGALLVADTTTAEIASTTGGGGNLDCSGAALSQQVLWPPDHKMVALTIVGLDQSFQLTILSIQQDEPINALGSGNTAPDGYIVEQTAYVRAERAGPGTGRIYFITFNAMDPVTGNTCGPNGMTLQAYVPHDQGQGYTPIYTGHLWDSNSGALIL